MTELNDALLDGKVVLVSGGTQGLGAAVATAAARNGADIAVTGRREDVGEKFVAGLAETGTRALYVPPTPPTWPRAWPPSPRPWSTSAGSTAWSTAPG